MDDSLSVIRVSLFYAVSCVSLLLFLRASSFIGASLFLQQLAYFALLTELWRYAFLTVAPPLSTGDSDGELVIVADNVNG